MTARNTDPCFPPGSILREVHEQRAVGLHYGQRALLFQATDALAFAGLVASSQGKDAPFMRLASTAKTMEKIYFGSRAQAEAVAADVRAMHARVRGRISKDVGPWRAGTPYAADDPELLLWILACLADSALAIYERFVRRLTEDEPERFWQDYLLVGELFGLDPAFAPATFDDFRAYMDERLAGEELYVTEEARELALTVAFRLPVPRIRQPALAVSNKIVLGTLPPRVRRLYGLEWNVADELALEMLARWSRSTRGLIPARLRRGSCAASYDLIAREEARILAEQGQAA